MALDQRVDRTGELLELRGIELGLAGLRRLLLLVRRRRGLDVHRAANDGDRRPALPRRKEGLLVRRSGIWLRLRSRGRGPFLGGSGRDEA